MPQRSRSRRLQSSLRSRLLWEIHTSSVMSSSAWFCWHRNTGREIKHYKQVWQGKATRPTALIQYLSQLLSFWNETLWNVSIRKSPSMVYTLAGEAALTSGLLLWRSEVLRRLRYYLRAQSRAHHTIDRLEKRGVERGSARRSSLKGRVGAIINQTNIGTVPKFELLSFSSSLWCHVPTSSQ